MLVSLDFPQGEQAKAAVPNPARNDELSKKYEIQYFPSVILMTADGEEYLRTSNIGVEAAEYLEHIRTSAAGAKKALAAARSIKEKYAKAEDKAAVVREAIAAMAEVPEGASSLKTLAEVVRQGLALDPENKSGLKLASLTALLQSGTASPGEGELALTMDPKNEYGLYEQVVAMEYGQIQDDDGMERFLAHAQTLYDCGKVHKKEKVSMAFAVAAYMLVNERDDAEKAKVFAAKALELGELPDYVVPILKEMLGESE